MARRRLSDYQVFVAAALRSVRGRSLAEMREALRQAAAAWRAQHRAANPGEREPVSEPDEALTCPRCDEPISIPHGVRTGLCPQCRMRLRVVR